MELTDLGKSLKRRIRKLAEGTPPAELDLPADWGARGPRSSGASVHAVVRGRQYACAAVGAQRNPCAIELWIVRNAFLRVRRCSNSPTCRAN